MSYLDNFLVYGSQLLHLVCFVICGLASWRISKVLGERCFALAAVAVGISVSLHVLLMLVSYLAWFMPAEFWSRINMATFQLYFVGTVLDVSFMVLFAVGAIRRGLMAKRAAVREAVPD